MAVFRLNEGKVIFDKDSPNHKVGRVKVVKEDDGTYTVYVNNEEHANRLNLSQLKTYLINKKDFGADKKLSKEINNLTEDKAYKINRSSNMRNLRESFEDDQREVDEIALNNGFLDDMVDSLQISNMIEKTDDGWVYLRSDYGGRDFFDEIPIQYIDENEIQEIEEYCILDSGIEDYDWGGYSGDIGYVQELLFDHFADLLIDHLDDLDVLAQDESLHENTKRRRKIKEYFRDDAIDDEQKLRQSLKKLPDAVQEGIDTYWDEPENLEVYLQALMDVGLLALNDVERIKAAPAYFNGDYTAETNWMS